MDKKKALLEIVNSEKIEFVESSNVVFFMKKRYFSWKTRIYPPDMKAIGNFYYFKFSLGPPRSKAKHTKMLRGKLTLF